MIASFDDFWKFLESNEVWFEYNCKMRFFDRDPKACARDCYGYLISDMKVFQEMQKDEARLRKYFVSWLMKAPRAAVAPTLQQVEEPKQEGPPPLTGEERMKRLKEWLDQVQQAELFAPVPKLTHKQIAEEGQWLPKKPEAYKPDNDIYLFKLKEAIHNISGRKYKGMYRFDGFKHFNIGLVTVFAKDLNDANEIFQEAELTILTEGS